MAGDKSLQKRRTSVYEQRASQVQRLLQPSTKLSLQEAVTYFLADALLLTKLQKTPKHALNLEQAVAEAQRLHQAEAEGLGTPVGEVQHAWIRM
jgi:hypothetical protein